MKLTTNRLNLMDVVTVDGVQERDPLTLNYRDFEPIRAMGTHEVTTDEVNRAYLVAYQEYSSVNLWWFVLAVNGVVDPWALSMTEYLQVPNLLDYYDWYRSQSGA